MVFTPWSQAETELLVQMTQQGHSFKEISDAIGQQAFAEVVGFNTRSPNAVEKRSERVFKTKATSAAPAASDVKERWASIHALQEKYTEASKFSKVGILTKPATRKILSLSDIHFPFARMDLIDQALKDHADASAVVLNGDILEGYIHSTFDKDRSVAAIDEYNCAFEFVLRCSKLFKKVFLVEGNHDVRAFKAIKRTGMSPDAYTIFSPGLLARIANGERLDSNGLVKSRIPFKNVYFPPTEPWWIQVGKTLFIHPHSRGSNKPGWTVSTWAKKFQERLPAGSYDSVVCGHTHMAYKGIVNGTMLIEQGCLCDAMGYSWQPQQAFSGSAMSGYAVIWQDEQGNTDFNKSEMVYLGELMPKDKPVFSGGFDE